MLPLSTVLNKALLFTNAAHAAEPSTTQLWAQWAEP